MFHTHQWTIVDRIDRAPIDPDDDLAHTTFTVLACACGACTVFPRENYALVTPAYRATLERQYAIELDVA